MPHKILNWASWRQPKKISWTFISFLVSGPPQIDRAADYGSFCVLVVCSCLQIDCCVDTQQLRSLYPASPPGGNFILSVTPPYRDCPARWKGYLPCYTYLKFGTDHLLQYPPRFWPNKTIPICGTQELANFFADSAIWNKLCLAKKSG